MLGGDLIAAAYTSDKGGHMYRATTAEYKDPFLYGNEEGSLTQEEKALQRTTNCL